MAGHGDWLLHARHGTGITQSHNVGGRSRSAGLAGYSAGGGGGEEVARQQWQVLKNPRLAAFRAMACPPVFPADNYRFRTAKSWERISLRFWIPEHTRPADRYHESPN